MAHVDDGQLNALLDGELPAEALREVEAHVATCAECARRLDEARAFLSEAGELLAVLTPPPRAAEPIPPVATAPRIAKTSKEIAVSVDGRTAMTPAIRPVFPHEVPPLSARRSWQLPDLEKLAWAASLVLCLGVGYLANEVYHLKQQQTTADTGRQPQTEVAVNTAVPAASATPADRRAEAPAERQSAGSSAGPSGRLSAERAPNAAPARPKPPVTKPAPSFARPRAEQIAANVPAPAAAPRPPAAPSAGALADVAGVAAPSAASSAGGVGARSQDRANALDETSAAARALAPRAPVQSAVQRVSLEEAVRRLSGSIRLIDGMNPSRVEVAPGRLVSGADPDREVIRVTYTSGLRRLVLDQQLGDTLQGSSFNGLMAGDTLVTALGSNGTQVRWIDRKFWLSLTGDMAADSVRVLVERIR
jgi:hypothetical protein